MDYGDDYWGLYRDYYRDPFPRRFGLRVWVYSGLLDLRFRVWGPNT